MPSVHTVDGKVVEIRQKTSVIITIFAALAWLAVVVFVVVALFALVFPFGFAVSIASLVVAVIAAIGAKILSFLRTRADVSLESASVIALDGSSVTLRRDRSFWITLEMILALVLGFLILTSLIVGGSLLPSVGLGGALGIFGAVGGLVLLGYIFVLNFLRKKLVIPSAEITIVDTEGRHLRLREHASIWIGLGMVVSILYSLFLLYVLIMGLSNSSAFAGFLSRLSPELGELRLLSDLSPAFVVVAFLFSLIEVAVLNFLRTKVNLEEPSGDVRSVQPVPLQPGPAARTEAAQTTVAGQTSVLFCRNCGAQIRRDSSFCSSCGKPV